MNQSTYDVIVIGAGLSGLTSAALLARAGRKVLLVEKEPEVGGYLSSLWHSGAPFIKGPRLLTGCQGDGPYGPGVIYDLLDQLGVIDQCEFVRLQPFIGARLPGVNVPHYSGREAFVEGMRASGVGRFERLPELLALCGRIYQAGLRYYAAQRPLAMLPDGRLHAEALRYQNATMEDVLRRYLPDARERAVIGAVWAYLGLPPSQASFISWAALFAGYVDEGAFFVRGGLHHLPEALAGAFQRDGGELRLGMAAAQLLVEERRVRGVRLADGELCFASQVIANLDPRQVLGELVEPAERPHRYLGRLGRMELAVRAMGLSLVTELDLPGLGFGFDTIVIDDWDQDRAWHRLEQGGQGTFSLTLLDAADSEMARPGQHLVYLFTSLPANYDPTGADELRMAQRLLAAADAVAPGLQASDYHTTVFEPIYGWACSPRYSALKRLGPRTPIRGLLLTGQWVRPGPSAFAVVLSGREAARMV